MHQPSVRVLKLLSDALNVSAETLLAQAGLLAASQPGEPGQPGGPAKQDTGAPVEAAIRADQRLSDEQKTALIAVYRSMLGS